MAGAWGQWWMCAVVGMEQAWGGGWDVGSGILKTGWALAGEHIRAVGNRAQGGLAVWIWRWGGVKEVGARSILETCWWKSMGRIGLGRSTAGWEGYRVCWTVRLHGTIHPYPWTHHMRLFVPFTVFNFLVIKHYIIRPKVVWSRG